MRRVATLAVAAAALSPFPALAQTPPPKPAAPAEKAVEGVTVTGQGTETRASIDRKSYDVTKDLAATTGSIADALRNIPSVDVDPNGAVSLRGDTGVTILIDGKPTGLFRGPGAGAALQSMPASQVERVEVITNPSAQFSPEGSAGIINLITRQSRGAGLSGSARANLGGAGRRNGGANLSYNSRKLTLSLDASARHDPQHSVDVDERITPGPEASRTAVDLRGPLDQWNARGGIDYDLDDRTRLSGELRHNENTFEPFTLTEARTVDAGGRTVLAREQTGVSGARRETTGGQVSLRRRFAGDDHQFTVNLSREQIDETPDQRLSTTTLVPAEPGEFRRIFGENRLLLTQLKADYSRPMPDEAKLKAGYDLRVDDNRYDNRGLIGGSAADAGADPGQTNLFLYKQTVNGAYATYERPFGDWTALAGLRLEDVTLDLDQVTTGFRGSQDYLRAYPSLHLADRLDDTRQLTLSYSRRVTRPQPQDLNPFRVTGDFDARQGNPNLKPQDTHSFEAGWQYKDKGSLYLATAYYRQSKNGVTDLYSDLGDGVLLTRKANLARSRNAGVELVASGKLGKTLTYNASANLYWTEIEAGALGLSARRSGFAAGGRGSLSWQATPKDLFQINASLSPKRLLPQGVVEPMPLVFLGYRHKFDDSLSLVVTAQDPFDIYKYKRRLDTPGLIEREDSRGRIQSAYVGLTYSFGAKKRDTGFDFSGG